MWCARARDQFETRKLMSRVILITGVSRGIGRALVGEFVKAGHTIYGCARSEVGIEELETKFGRPHRFRKVDVADESQVRDWAGELLGENLPPPDLLINNAALINRNAALWKVPASEFDKVMAVNINGVANVIRCFLPPMMEAGRGVIVNLSSGWGRSTSPEVVPYCTSKWAIEGLTQGLAQELPPELAAIPLSPGTVDTDMLRSCMGEGASSAPSADAWAKRAAPFILKLGPKDSGQPLTVPR